MTLSKRLSAIVLICFLLMQVLPLFAEPVQAASAPDIAEGEGSSTSPYIITSAYELDQVRYGLDLNYRLGADIDLAGLDAGDGEGWLPIGDAGAPFAGTFNGNGYVIRNLAVHRPDSDNVGLFGQAGGSLANVALLNVDVEGGNNVGSLAGYSTATVQNSFATGSVVGGSDTGGLVGHQESGGLTNTYAIVDVTGGSNTGGLVGSTKANITVSYAAGKVTSTGTSPAGGLVGRNDNAGIQKAYALGDVTQTGGVGAGGLVGFSNGSVSSTYSAGKVTASKPGGLIYEYNSGLATGYYNKTVNPSVPLFYIDWGGFSGGGGLTETEMKTKSKYRVFSLTGVWAIRDGQTYPYLLPFSPILSTESLGASVYNPTLGQDSLAVSGAVIDGSIGEPLHVVYTIRDSSNQSVASEGYDLYATGEEQTIDRELSLAEVSDGTYTVEVTASDNVNPSVTRSFPFTVDTTAPEITISPNGNAEGAARPSAVVTANDSLTGLSALQYVWTQDTEVPTSGWASFSSGDTLSRPGASGEWYLHIRAVDTAGNQADVASNVFYPTYRVAYLGNGNTEGTAPVDSDLYAVDEDVTLPGNPNGLSRTGYSFAGWNTAADGSGTAYEADDTFTMGASDVTLYAQWAANTYSVSYDGNGSTGGSVPASVSQAYNTDVTVSGNTGNLVKTGYAFAGWNTAADGSGTAYEAGDVFALGTGDVTLYAQWAANTYSVNYDGNGSTGGSTPELVSQAYNTDVTVSGNTGNLVKTGYAFAGWNTAADGSGTAYGAGDVFALGAGDVTLYAQWTANTYSVGYDGNGSTGGIVPAPVSQAYNTDVTVSGNTGYLVKTGYAFAGWNTAADGSGTGYEAGDVFALGAGDVTLYAQWTANTYSVSYDGNGSTEGSVPAPVSQAYNTDVTVSGNTGYLVKTGYAFVGWNTAADGSGTAYEADDMFTLGAGDVTLYAQWTANTYSVSYDGNGSTGGSAPSPVSQAYGTDVTVSGNTGNLEKTGYAFVGWNTAADGSGTAYEADDVFTLGAGDVTLYAQWTANTYSVSYDGNGSTGGSAPSPVSQTYNTDVTVSGNTGNLEKTGYTFAGWSTAVDGSGTAYEADDTFKIGASDVTLYAQWTVNMYSVSYDGNGSTGGSVPSPVSQSYDSDVTVSDNTGDLVRTGYTFTGWNTVADGSGTAYEAGATLTVPATNVTLYAQWMANTYNVSYDGNGSTGGSAPSPVSQVYDTDVTVSGNTGDLEKTGYTFAGWNTAADGSGVAYEADDVFTLGAADVVLYAQWTANTYSVNYDGNGSTGGSAPALVSQAYDTDITVSGNTGDLVKTGYTFAGWNTEADGSGTAYDADDMFKMGASDVTLYAQWTANTYSVSYDGNGSTRGSVPTSTSQVYNTDITISGNTGNLEKTGYAFAGWNTEADGSGTAYEANDVFTLGAGDVTLYAQWTANTYSVSYDGNGSTGGSAPSPASQSYNTDVTVSGNTGNLAKTGYTFAGWNTAVDGSGTAYEADDVFKISASDVILYAQWTANTYNVSYDGNRSMGGSVPAQVSQAYGTDVTVSGNTGYLVKTGYAFAGWNTATDGSGTAYEADDVFALGAGDVTLYAQWTANTYSVSYDGNGSTEGSVPTPVSQAYHTDVTVSGNTGNLEKTGYTFAGWNTATDGTGEAYEAGATLTVSADDVTLFAQWTANTYSVSYDGNGSTGGSIPAPVSQAYHTDVTVSGNTGNLEKTGYTFAGWNTAANGSGTFYDTNDTFKMGASDVVLYAQWTANTYSVSYDGNGSMGGSVPTSASQAYNTDVTVSGNTGDLEKTGYSFAGWNTASDGSGTAYEAGATLIVPATDVTLYAQWTANTYSVSYDGNGSTEGSVPAPASQAYNTDVTVSGNTGDLEKTGYSFAGWNTASDGSGTAYEAGATLTVPAGDVTLYAQWTANTYSVSYDGNGSTGGSVPASVNQAYGTDVTVQGNTGHLAKPGYTFAGWNTAADGSGTAYEAGATLTVPAADVTLFAQWTTNPTFTVTYNGNGNEEGSVPTDSGAYEQGAEVAVQGNTGHLAKPGYTFAGWNTAADGSGTAYGAEATLTIPASDVTLFAQWTTNPTFTITYNGNGSTEGNVPTDSGAYEQGAEVAVQGNTGNLTKSGYTFAGWNTAPDGSGTAYGVGATLTVPAADVTLYAQWLSGNAMLAGLDISAGTIVFSPSNPNYTVRVANEVSSVDLFITLADPTQTLTVAGAVYQSVAGSVYDYQAPSLIVGDNPIQIQVAAQDGSTSAYTVIVARADSNELRIALDPSRRTYSLLGGASITLPDDLVIPEGASLTVSLSNAAPSAGEGLAKAGQVIAFRFEGITIDRPVDITLAYDGSPDLDTSKLAIYYHNESTGKWEFVPSEVAGSGVKATVGHFSTYGVLADTTAPDGVSAVESGKDERSITLTLAANDDSGIDKFLIYRDGRQIGESKQGTYVDSGLSPSHTYVYQVKAVDRLGNVSDFGNELSVTTNDQDDPAPPVNPPGGSLGDATEAPGQSEQLAPAGITLSINGHEVPSIAKAVSSEMEGKTVLTVTIDSERLTGQLAHSGIRPDVVLSVDPGADRVSAILSGDGLQAMADQEAALEIQTPIGRYRLPANAVIDQIARQFGEQAKLSDIAVQVDIAKSDAAKTQLLKKAADQGGFAIVAAPVDFAVSAAYGGRTVSVNAFGSYVQREIPLADDVNPGAVSTAIAWGPDGKSLHAPTYVTTRDGGWYAVVNSMNNGTFALIEHPMSFADVEGHWSQEAVNDMASRMVVNGVDSTRYNPGAPVTRAEFAAIVVRALGLAGKGGAADFGDVRTGDWHFDWVAIAQEYGIVTGYEDGTFRPDKTVTREEAMAMILRAMALAGLDTSIGSAEADAALAPFADRASVDAWARQAAAVAVAGGLAGGSGSELRPKSDMTRAETAVIVRRLLEKAGLIGTSSED